MKKSSLPYKEDNINYFTKPELGKRGRFRQNIPLWTRYVLQTASLFQQDPANKKVTKYQNTNVPLFSQIISPTMYCTSIAHERKMLPTTLDDAGSNNSNDLQANSGSCITPKKANKLG